MSTNELDYQSFLTYTTDISELPREEDDDSPLSIPFNNLPDSIRIILDKINTKLRLNFVLGKKMAEDCNSQSNSKFFAGMFGTTPFPDSYKVEQIKAVFGSSFQIGSTIDDETFNKLLFRLELIDDNIMFSATKLSLDELSLFYNVILSLIHSYESSIIKLSDQRKVISTEFFNASSMEIIDLKKKKKTLYDEVCINIDYLNLCRILVTRFSGYINGLIKSRRLKMK